MKITRTMVLWATLLLGAAASAQTARPYSLIVPFPPGGPADAVARSIQQPLREALDGTVIIENLPGSGGILGAARLLRAEPDGQTLLLATIGETALTPLSNKAARYDAEDFRLVTPLARSQLVLVSRPGLPVKTLDDLVTLGRAAGAKPLSYATNGPGSIFHLASEAFLAQTGMKATHVPYKGHAPVFTDLIGEHIDIAFLPMAGSVIGMITQGKVRALAISGSQRSPQLPQVPTVQEAARLKSFEFSIWPGVFVHKSTPEPVVRKLHQAVSQAMAAPAYQKFTVDSGAALQERISGNEIARFYEEQTRMYREVAASVDLGPK